MPAYTRDVNPALSSARPSERKRRPVLFGLFALLVALHGPAAASGETPGVSNSAIRIGGVMDLEGDSKGLGQGMKDGIEAALRGEKVQGRKVEFTALNDFYDPQHTIEKTHELIDEGVFAMLGNVGTPTAKVSLPVLAENKVPAVGFFTGAGLLRPGVGNILNYRASYVQEIASTIDAAIKAGVAPTEICAYVQNDAYGMAGVEGVKRALKAQPGTESIVASLDQIMAVKGLDPARNNIGPVGVYTRNTLTSREGYTSLKNWEKKAGTRCRLVVTVGTYTAIGNFIAYSRYKGEYWVTSAVSFTGAENLRALLKEYGVISGVLVSEVVPQLDSSLAIVKQARKALGDNLSYVSLEGYIVGKVLLHGLQEVHGDLTREAFVDALRGKRFNLGGLDLDFTTDNQASDLVNLIELQDDGYRPITPQKVARLFGVDQKTRP
jgi:branched-chain amino acid transport system substrate-binding protein